MQDPNHPVSKANSIAERVGKAQFTKRTLRNIPEDYSKRAVFLSLIDCVKNNSGLDFGVKLPPFSKQSKS